MDIIIIIALIALLLAGVFLLPRLLNKDARKPSKSKKDAGVKKACKVVQNFATYNDCKYLPACRFTKNGEITDISAILIGRFGVFAILANGRNGEVYGTETDKNWVQIIAEKKEYFPNPIKQANEAVMLLREPLSNKKIHNVQIECIPVFTAPKLTLGVAKSCKYYTTKQLKATLFNDKYITDKKVNVDKVYDALKEYVINK